MTHANDLTAYADTTDKPGIFVRLRQTFADRRKYMATYDEINVLSDRELADLDLSRQCVREIARKAVYGN